MNPDDVPSFRSLFFEIQEYQGTALYRDVLEPWQETGRQSLHLSRQFQAMGPYDRNDESQQIEMWNMYALGRVFDLLLLPFQPTRHDRDATCGAVTLEEYITFFTALGLTRVERTKFSPFFHEIVQLDQTEDPDHPLFVQNMLWPGFLFGELMVARSGVAVTGGVGHGVKDLAENSTLYFTWKRHCRPTYDLSMGWGSNSQWRTAARRDYWSNGGLHYNVDGRIPLHLLPPSPPKGSWDNPDELIWPQRVDLCRNRCLTLTVPEGGEEFMVADRYSEPDNGLSPITPELTSAWNEFDVSWAAMRGTKGG